MRMTILSLLPTLLLPGMAMHTTAHAAPVNVRGTIITPACKLEIGLHDHYPLISYSQLNAGRPTVLQPKFDDLTITCPVTAKVGLSFKDNHADGKVPGMRVGNAPADFGLALHGRFKVGALLVEVLDAQGDRRDLIARNAIGASWRDDSGTLLPSTVVAWNVKGLAGPFAPGAFLQIAAKLRITPIVVRREELPRGQSIGVGAHLTSELHYL